MTCVNVPFELCLRKIVRTNNYMANAGVVDKMKPDGLIGSKPGLYTPRFPSCGMVPLMAAIFVFKGICAFRTWSR